eukprot:CAMPEP_0181172140 /NCGR_PEP_ID=MMETSP1096-20121128/2293_1 /TAXON_ID=156174 ORGANISM="Chrysochromulina ericina, Strain CCMP281" /NCGR_SAMPLE_ID=MMETSP1096 /ASSEMBLY_ACC=CAM_ASM_000453 /LENGTH=126 /DNA_ID=CAMNT_0023259853 /DNA_START=119 /DNA_END=497 /DNA_ORIENTATION=+
MCAARQLPPSWGNETTASPMQCELGLISDDQHDARNVSDSNLPRPQSLEPISGRPPTFLGPARQAAAPTFGSIGAEGSVRCGLLGRAASLSGLEGLPAPFLALSRPGPFRLAPIPIVAVTAAGAIS